MAMTVEAELNRIHILSETLANQIAAGEVIERPASVIKELLENSIDAGATDIRIEIEAGGTELIRVLDNGHGIHRDDLTLALQSHATSKIRQQSDLHHITSLGFRGEALSSIASVSRFQLISRLLAAEQAWQISRDPLAGNFDLTPASHPHGTTVVVQDLFHATPARRKFLRSERTEFLHVLEMIRRIALSRYEVGIRLIHNGKQVFHSRSNNAGHDDLIRTVMGESFKRSARTIDNSSTDMRLWGWLGAENQSRSQTDRQYFYFNGRMIRDKQVNHAIRMAYEGILPTGRFPTYVLFMEADPASADVNVHPTKYEIRFRNARDVHDFIYSSLRNCLTGENRLFSDSSLGNDHNVHSQSRSAPGRMVGDQPQFYRVLSESGQAGGTATEGSPLGQPVAQLFGRFILVQRDSQWLLVDSHQARRHIVNFRMSAVTDAAPERHRPLLVPVVIEVPEAEAELIDIFAGLIDRYGLTLERYAPDAVIVRNIPALMPEVELQPLVRDVLNGLAKARDTDSMPALLVAVFVAHACDGYQADLTVEHMLRLLRSLTDTGIDLQSASHAGIWKTLDAAELTDLLKHQ